MTDNEATSRMKTNKLDGKIGRWFFSEKSSKL